MTTQIPTPTHSFISIGKRQRELLKYLNFLTNEERLNIKQYARINKINRSNVYDDLNKLESYNLIERNFGNNTITQKGRILLQTTNEGVSESSRKECRNNNQNLSTHWHKFTLKIIKRKDNWQTRINLLKGVITHNHIKNLNQTFIKLNEATITINPKVVIITFFDILTENVEDSDIISFSKLTDLVTKLYEVGIVTEGVTLEQGHWARVGSIFSDMLHKIDNRYYLDFGDGYKFWIDQSTGQREDETNDKQFRERLDFDLLDLRNNESYSRSDTKSMIDKLAIISQNMVTGIVPAINELKETQRAFSRDFKVHVPVMREMGRSAKETQKTMKQMYNLLSQKKLGEFV